MRNGGITPRQYAVMEVVHHSQGMALTQISRATGIDESTVHEINKRLINKGLLERQKSRAFQYRLTDKGSRAIEEAHSAIVRADKKLLESFTSSDRIVFEKCL